MIEARTIRFWRGRLPHWEVANASYFITLRLAGCLPHTVRTELDAELASSTTEDLLARSRAYFVKLERWLDRHTDKAWLTEPSVARMLADAFDAYAQSGVWRLHAWVVMPNHAHWFFTPGNRSVTSALRGFKRYTAREANRLLGRAGQRFWQVEWFDHWSRSPHQSDRIMAYIRNNPVKAGLVPRASDWPYVG